MENYILSCTSTVDISKEHLESRDIHYICFNYNLDGKDYKDDLGVTMPIEKFYNLMEEGLMTKTSQPSTGDYFEYFKNFLAQGKDVIHFTLSSGISGDLNSATLGAKMALDEFPDRKIIVVDSLCASGGYGLLMDKLADLRDQGMNMEELEKWALEHRLEVNHWFFSTDLQYYVRGGRISKTSGFIGGILHICPLLNVDNQGKLVGREKCHGAKKAEQRMVEMMEEWAQDGLDYAGKCYISMSRCLDLAQPVADMIEQRFKKMNGKVLINNIGTTIGSHTGPGTVALFFWGKPRQA